MRPTDLFQWNKMWANIFNVCDIYFIGGKNSKKKTFLVRFIFERFGGRFSVHNFSTCQSIRYFAILWFKTYIKPKLKNQMARRTSTTIHCTRHLSATSWGQACFGWHTLCQSSAHPEWTSYSILNESDRKHKKGEGWIEKNTPRI